MSRLVAYLQFSGNCKEAMTFYQKCLGGELTLLPVGESQMAGQMPAEMHSQIMHSALKSGEIELMASDNMGQGTVTHGDSVGLCLVCSSKEDIETFFKNLSEGGIVGHPLKEEFFGTFGDLTDKFGFRWMLQFDGK